ncbi:MAG TPA: hypothetical protein VF179_09505, partial [Thermoanaerobaculia bacterium]|nr:hypothetical protein [Thermoanaerobaculia bacterium]
RQDSRRATDYPGCNPRVDPDPQAWLENLVKQRVRWVFLYRFPRVKFPREVEWIQARPDLFELKYENQSNLIFEFLPVARLSP